MLVSPVYGVIGVIGGLTLVFQMYDRSMTDVHTHLMKRTADRQLLFTTEYLNVHYPTAGEKADM